MTEQTFNPDSEGQELSPAEGEKDVQENLDSEPEEESLVKKLSDITGREFKDEEDFKKHYKELSSFVGKNPKELEEKAKLYDEQLTKSKDKLEKAQSGGSSTEEIQVLKDKIEEMELLKDYPESSKILNTIRDVANSRKVTLKEAFESDLQDLLKSKLEAEKRQEEERNSSVESKSRVSSSKANKITSLAEQVKTSGSDEDKEALVKEFLTE